MRKKVSDWLIATAAGNSAYGRPDDPAWWMPEWLAVRLVGIGLRMRK